MSIQSQRRRGGGDHTKVLGYKYTPLEDLLHPGISEFNLNKKIKGARKPNPFPVRNAQDVVELMDSKSISKAEILGKIHEFYAPLGVFEPLRLFMKLKFANLSDLPWHSSLPQHIMGPNLQALP